MKNKILILNYLSILLFVAVLIKADKYEWMIQKATEMGASEFIAVGMDRSVVKLNESKVAKK